MMTIIDYGMGNLRSVEKAFEYLGFPAQITESPEAVLRADHVVLPGVGAFSDAMTRLRQTGLGEAAVAAVKRGTPLLGICLGMQLLFEGSQEGGYHQGLGLLPGSITRIPDRGLKVPHMGWNTLQIARDSLLFDVKTEPYAYFVHSYHMAEISPEWTSASAEYGVAFTAAVEKENLLGTQFHPEKSGDAGLAMLKRFALL